MAEYGIGASRPTTDMGKVSLVGAGMKSHPGVAAKTFRVLGDAGVNIEMISTSPIKISCVVRGTDVPRPSAAARRVRAGRGRDPARGRRGRPPTEGELDMRVAVVGATGAVGCTILGVMRERSFPADEIVPFASERSAGRTIDYGDQDLTVRRAVRRVDPGLRHGAVLRRSATSAEWGPKFADAGAVVVDNSSHWRMHDDVPLVVSEVNPEALDGHDGIVANPNCTTMEMVVALKPIYDAVGIERLVVSTYQAVSGTGQRADRGAPRPGRGVIERQGDPGAVDVSAPDRLQRAAPGREVQGRRRLHDRGAQGDGRDPQDPGRTDRA